MGHYLGKIPFFNGLPSKMFTYRFLSLSIRVEFTIGDQSILLQGLLAISNKVRFVFLCYLG